MVRWGEWSSEVEVEMQLESRGRGPGMALFKVPDPVPLEGVTGWFFVFGVIDWFFSQDPRGVQPEMVKVVTRAKGARKLLGLAKMV